jgi:hypothetical protein
VLQAVYPRILTKIRFQVAPKPSGLSILYLWVKTLEPNSGIIGCELPIN